MPIRMEMDCDRKRGLNGLKCHGIDPDVEILVVVADDNPTSVKKSYEELCNKAIAERWRLMDRKWVCPACYVAHNIRDMSSKKKKNKPESSVSP